MKKLLVIIESSPYDELHFNEALDFAFMAGAYGLECFIFLAHTDLKLFLSQQNQTLVKKILSADLYDIKKIYVQQNLAEIIDLIAHPLFCEVVDLAFLEQAFQGCLVKFN